MVVHCRSSVYGSFFMSNIAIFIDGAYLDHIQELPKREQIDFVSLVHTIAQNIPILRVYYYHCPPRQYRNQSRRERDRYSRMHKFLERMQMLPNFEVRRGKLQEIRNDDDNVIDVVQKQVDVLLSIDLVHLASKRRITNAALVTGDSDFIPAIKLAKNEGVHITLWYSAASEINRGLLAAADQAFALETDYLPFTTEEDPITE